MAERVREAIENAVLASAIANEPFGAQAARATKAALEASHHAELVEALRAHIGECLDSECSRCASDRALLAKIGGEA
jgi:hypothetical protein